jgi:hypothetical protein
MERLFSKLGPEAVVIGKETAMHPAPSKAQAAAQQQQ